MRAGLREDRLHALHCHLMSLLYLLILGHVSLSKRVVEHARRSRTQTIRLNHEGLLFVTNAPSADGEAGKAEVLPQILREVIFSLAKSAGRSFILAGFNRFAALGSICVYTSLDDEAISQDTADPLPIPGLAV